MIVSAFAAGCGGGDDGGFVTSELASVPASALGDGAAQITVTDLGRLSDLAGLPDPAADRTGQELATWTGQMTFGVTVPGGPQLVGFLPAPVGSVAAWTTADEIRGATGIALGGVERIITVDSPPSAFTVMAGDIELAESLADVGDGVVSYGEGDDLAAGEPTPWNQTGAPIRFAESDGAIAWSRTTPSAEEFAAGSDRTLADDPALASLAATLDGKDVVSAVIVTGDFTAPDPAAATAVAPFSAVAVGVTQIEDEARTIVVYAFADDGTAEGAVAALTAAWADGADAEGRPIGEQFAVLGSASDGRTAMIELVPVGGESTQGPARLLFTGASVFRHG